MKTRIFIGLILSPIIIPIILVVPIYLGIIYAFHGEL